MLPKLWKWVSCGNLTLKRHTRGEHKYVLLYCWCCFWSQNSRPDNRRQRLWPQAGLRSRHWQRLCLSISLNHQNWLRRLNHFEVFVAVPSSQRFTATQIIGESKLSWKCQTKLWSCSRPSWGLKPKRSGIHLGAQELEWFRAHYLTQLCWSIQSFCFWRAKRGLDQNLEWRSVYSTVRSRIFTFRGSHCAQNNSSLDECLKCSDNGYCGWKRWEWKHNPLDRYGCAQYRRKLLDESDPLASSLPIHDHSHANDAAKRASNSDHIF